MAALTLGSGCGCIKLRTSSFIIGYIDLVLCIIFSTIALTGALGGAVVAVEAPKTEQQRMGAVIMVISAITLACILVMLAFTVTLLVGLHKNRRILVKVYLIAAAIFFLLDFIMFFVGFVHENSVAIIVARSTFLILEAYSFVIIRSYYFEMDGSGKRTYTTA